MACCVVSGVSSSIGVWFAQFVGGGCMGGGVVVVVGGSSGMGWWWVVGDG